MNSYGTRTYIYLIFACSLSLSYWIPYFALLRITWAEICASALQNKLVELCFKTFSSEYFLPFHEFARPSTYALNRTELSLIFHLPMKYNTFSVSIKALHTAYLLSLITLLLRFFVSLKPFFISSFPYNELLPLIGVVCLT